MIEGRLIKTSKKTSKQMNDIEDIRLRDDVVIVEACNDKEIGGILIPESIQENGQTGIVCNTGPGFKEGEAFDPLELKIGDKIYYCKYAGSEIQIEGNKYMIMRQGDVLAKYCGPRCIDLTPLEDRVLIEWETGQDCFSGTSIKRPEGSAKERYFTGIIVSVGSKVKEIGIGERVFFDQFCGPERIDFQDKRYALIWERDAYCIIPARKNIMVLSH